MNYIIPPEIEGFWKNLPCPFCKGHWEQKVPEKYEDKKAYFRCALCLRKITIEERI